MSQQVDPRIERLIVRRLDGELTANEQLELDRALVRDPAARQLLEDYGRIDRAAADALACAFASPGVVEARASIRLTDPHSDRRGAYSKLWWALPAAIAAGIAIMVVLTESSPTTQQVAVRQPQAPVPGEVAPTHVVPEGRSPILQTRYAPGKIERSTTTDDLYIVGADGNLYVIERQHISTARKPKSGIVQVSGDL
ncbi:MAG: anti-sigma factor family protein [Phycisphaerae bacterium]